MEQSIRILSDECQLEGLLDHRPEDAAGLVVTHPHPLYGGDMYNAVVTSVVRAARGAGWTALRFNFRGVGGSKGHHSDGPGEQADVRAAVAFLQKLGLKRIVLAGYSFGSWVNAHIIWPADQAPTMIMIAPPVGFMNFDQVKRLPHLKLVIAGDHDEIAPLALIQNLLPQWNPQADLKVFAGADHFYSNFLDRLEALLSNTALLP